MYPLEDQGEAAAALTGIKHMGFTRHYGLDSSNTLDHLKDTHHYYPIFGVEKIEAQRG